MAANSKGKVLLADDDPDVLRTFTRVIQVSGYEVTPVPDGLAAIDALKNGSFDVVVSDISMPRLDGLGLLQEVRQHDLDVPVILLTGEPGLPTALRAIEHGAYRYLSKPCENAVLMQTIAQACRLHQIALIKRQALATLELENRSLGDRASLESRFTSALETLYMAYQPIIAWKDRRCHAYEALVRTKEPTVPHPGALLDAAERLDRLHDLGRCIRKAIAQNIKIGAPAALIFVNLHLRDLLDEELYAKDAPLRPYASQIVLELTERASLHECTDIQARVAELRKQGYRMAVDDLGAGYAGLSSFTLFEPEVVKLDMLLVRDIERSETKQKLVESMARLCGEMNIALVAEGIETGAERDVVVRLGCDLLQGYLFAKPALPFVTPTF
ncbi:MAG: EAL domain-containing response regulator [Deltaproteobacteria bacterium]|nr:EAL domain-containing response regulator [Deltaproteobacteria bacterium]